MSETAQLLTHSRMACAKSCLRKHYYRYEVGIARDRGTAPLRIGQAVHLGLDILARGSTLAQVDVEIGLLYQDTPPWVEDRTDWLAERETIMALLCGYEARWGFIAFEVVESEIAFDLPLRNPDTGAQTPVFKLAGKIDKIVRLPDGRLAVMEHKTCSEDLSPESDYWRRLRLDQQISLYYLAARRMGYDVQTVLYDVIRKPDLRRLRATPIENRNYKKDGSLYASQRDSDETAQEYARRIIDAIGKEPTRYYARKAIARLDSDLIEFEHELWQIQHTLRSCQRHGRWYRNTAACLRPYKCEFFDLCCEGAYPIEHAPEGYVQLDSVHPELEEKTNGDGSTARTTDDEGPGHETETVPAREYGGGASSWGTD